MSSKLFSVACGMFLLTVCSRGDNGAVRAAPPAAPPAAAPAAAPAATPLAVPPAAAARDASTPTSQSGATISGKIKFTGAPPVNAPIDMSEEAACKAKYNTAPPRAEAAIVGTGGALANVFVYVSSGVPAGAKYQAPATAVVLDQDGCRYHPHVFGIMVGQQLEIRNSDPVLHNIKAKATKNRPFNVSQPSVGMKTTRTFSAPEVMVALECNVHGWMTAFAGVRADPFFAVTGTDGSFSLKGLPPGTYTIEAWHEKFGTQTATVTVAGTETKTANFTFAAR